MDTTASSHSSFHHPTKVYWLIQPHSSLETIIFSAHYTNSLQQQQQAEALSKQRAQAAQQQQHPATTGSICCQRCHANYCMHTPPGYRLLLMLSNHPCIQHVHSTQPATSSSSIPFSCRTQPIQQAPVTRQRRPLPCWPSSVTAALPYSRRSVINN